MMKKQKTEKGFVMILALFLTVAFATAIAGDFLSLTHQQRSVQQAADRVRVQWAIESIMAGTYRLFMNYVFSQNGYPDSDPVTKEVTGIKKIITGSAEDLFHRYVKEKWYPGVQTGTPGLENIDVDFLSVKEVQRDPGDSWREYQITVKVRKSSGSETAFKKSAARIRFKLNLNPLYNFASFYDKDLEITSGSDSEIQGPIFSNGNIYILPGQGKSLTFDAGSADYALATAQNVYYGFKRVAARNYMLCKSLDANGECVPQNTVYRDGAPAYLRTDNPDILEKGYLWDGNNWGSDLKDPYYRYMTYVPPGRRISGAVPEGTNHFFGGAQENNRKGMELFEGFDLARLSGAQYDWFPYIYFMKNGIFLGVDPTHPNSIFTKDGRGYLTEITPYRNISIYSRVYPFDFYYTAYTLHNDPALSATPHDLGPSSAIDVANFPHFSDASGNWSPENPATTAPVVGKQSMGNLIQINQDPKQISLGSVDETRPNKNHMLIEPVLQACLLDPDGSCHSGPDCDCPNAVAAKLQSQAEIQILCNSSNCSAYQVRFNGDNVRESDYRNWLFFNNQANFFDYRLGVGVPSNADGKIKTLDIHVGNLKNFLNDAVDGYAEKLRTDPSHAVDPDKNQVGFAVYIQTKLGGNSKAEVVRLINGSTVYKKGLTFITNGRLWIQGDYNTFEYTDAAGRSFLPPTAVFSDSFGILSKQWQDTGAGYDGRPASQGVNDVERRSVTQDVTINTAVITGYLPSQLEKKYPNCTGVNGPNYGKQPAVWGDCLDDAYYWIWSATPDNVGGYCPNGVNRQGQPYKPRACDYRVDMDTGIYYYRRVFLIAELFRRRYFQANNCHHKSGYDTDIYGEWTCEPDGLYNARLPSLSRVINGVSRSVDWEARTGDDVLIDCAKDTTPAPNNCWGNFLQALDTVNVASPTAANPGDPKYIQKIKILDGITNWKPTSPPNYQVDPITKEYVPVFTNPSDEKKSIPRWEIPIYIDPYSPRKPLPNTYFPNQSVPYLGALVLDDEHPPEGVAPYPGVYWMALASWPLYNTWVWQQCAVDTWLWVCDGNNQEGSSCRREYQKCPTDQLLVKYLKGGVSYAHGRGYPLYEARYSGGLENMINYQEDWREEVTVYFKGVLTAPWDSEELKKVTNGTPAYWNPNYRDAAKAYYSAPKRQYMYNPSLKSNPPPGLIRIYSLEPFDFRELDPDNLDKVIGN